MPRLPGEHRKRSLVTVEMGALMASLFAPEKLKAVEGAAPGRVLNDSVVVEENYIVTTHRIGAKWDFTIEHDGAVNRYPGQVLDPCHTTAVLVEVAGEDDFQMDGYYFGSDSQHCVGYTIMRLKSGDRAWPGIDNDEDLAERLCERVDWDAPVFESEEDFYAANDRADARTEVAAL